jgi:hypothetical protein
MAGDRGLFRTSLYSTHSGPAVLFKIIPDNFVSNPRVLIFAGGRGFEPLLAESLSPVSDRLSSGVSLLFCDSSIEFSVWLETLSLREVFFDLGDLTEKVDQPSENIGSSGGTKPFNVHLPIIFSPVHFYSLVRA